MILPLLPLADVVKLSEEDLAVLVGTADPEAGTARLREHGARFVVVTRGKDGSLCRTSRGCAEVPGFAVPVVDTTGTGDAFVGGLIAGLLAAHATGDGLDASDPSALRPALRLANAVGALTTTIRGAIPALPTRERVRDFLVERGEADAVVLLG